MTPENDEKGRLAVELTFALERAEKWICSRRYATRASVALPGMDRTLTYGKERGSWGLYLYGGTPGTPALDFRHASIEIRMKMAAAIPYLIGELELRASKQGQEIAKAARALNQYLDILGEK